MSLGRNLRNARLANGWTQEELGRRCGIPAMQVCHYECDRRAPTIDNLRKLCKALYASADSLLGLSPKRSVRRGESLPPSPDDSHDGSSKGEER